MQRRRRLARRELLKDKRTSGSVSEIFPQLGEILSFYMIKRHLLRYVLNRARFYLLYILLQKDKSTSVFSLSEICPQPGEILSFICFDKINWGHSLRYVLNRVRFYLLYILLPKDKKHKRFFSLWDMFSTGWYFIFYTYCYKKIKSTSVFSLSEICSQPGQNLSFICFYNIKGHLGHSLRYNWVGFYLLYALMR